MFDPVPFWPSRSLRASWRLADARVPVIRAPVALVPRLTSGGHHPNIPIPRRRQPIRRNPREHRPFMKGQGRARQCEVRRQPIARPFQDAKSTDDRLSGGKCTPRGGRAVPHVGRTSFAASEFSLARDRPRGSDPRNSRPKAGRMGLRSDDWVAAGKGPRILPACAVANFDGPSAIHLS